MSFSPNLTLCAADNGGSGQELRGQRLRHRHGEAVHGAGAQRQPGAVRSRAARTQTGAQDVYELGHPLMIKNEDKNINDYIDVNEVLVAGVHVLLQG